jgi:hypothetical protein
MKAPSYRLNRTRFDRTPAIAGGLAAAAPAVVLALLALGGTGASWIAWVIAG